LPVLPSAVKLATAVVPQFARKTKAADPVHPVPLPVSGGPPSVCPIEKCHAQGAEQPVQSKLAVKHDLQANSVKQPI
jgi:hypothetical protein